ncbi:TPA: hypothetical protein ONE32_003146 [Enterobacter cloacae subsp. cloacae]|nr:hypothetical protein [Enterobacter cloacae subsp. cloacae]
MSTITKEWLQQKIADMEAARDEIPFGLDEEDSNTLAALRIALASLEAGPYGYVHKAAYEQAGSCGLSSDHEAYRDSSTHIAVYTAPPAPASVQDNKAITPHFETISLLLSREIMYDVNRRHEFPGGDVQLVSRIQCKIEDAFRAAMLQGAEPVTTANKLPFDQWLSQQTGTIDVECGCVMTEVFFHWLRVAYEAGNSPVIPDGWVMVPKEPAEVMFNAGKLAAGPTKQPDTASLVYKAMIDSSPDYKVGRETAFTGYEVQENVKDYVRRKIHTAFDVEKAVLWILKNSKYPEPDLWVFDIKVQFVDGPVILTDKSVTVVHSTLCKCSPPVGNVQFIECTLPAEWEGKVNAIDCVFKAAPQQEVK